MISTINSIQLNQNTSEWLFEIIVYLCQKMEFNTTSKPTFG